MTDEALRTRNGQIEIRAAAQLLVAVPCIVLSLFAILWAVWFNVNPVPSQSEFFAYSWIYGVRWGAGENVFQPHSQLLFPVYALINWIFSAGSNPNSVFRQWQTVSQLWPAFLVLASLAILYATTSRKAPLTDVAVSSLVYVVAVPIFIHQTDLFSMSYHSLSVPLALASLWLWKSYEDDPERLLPMRFFVFLGLYTAICALGKPTFVAFALPFFAMETVKAVRGRNLAIAINLVTAAAIAVSCYLVYLLGFYRSIAGVMTHFALTRLFMVSQYHWYDQAKGATPFHWYFNYVIGVMGPLPSILIVASIVLAVVSKSRVILLSGVAVALGCAMYVLYHRSQLHGHPEFIALLATTTIAMFRCSGLYSVRPVSFFNQIEGGQMVTAIAITIAIIVPFALFFPLPAPDRSYMETMEKYDDVILPAIFHQPDNVRTVAISKYPDVLFGTTDAWCRGEGNLFDGEHSSLFDDRFGTACVTTPGAKQHLANYNRAVFRKKAELTASQAEAAIKSDFPEFSGRMKDCKIISDPLPDDSALVGCGLSSPD